MLNHWGQQVAIGSTVGVGFRRSGSQWHQLGVVVKLENRRPNVWSDITWVALVVWVSEERGDCFPHDGPIFTSNFPAEDLLVIDDESIAPPLLQALGSAYADWVFKHAPEPFVAPAR